MILGTPQERVKLLKAGADGKLIEKFYVERNNFKIVLFSASPHPALCESVNLKLIDHFEPPVVITTPHTALQINM